MLLTARSAAERDDHRSTAPLLPRFLDLKAAPGLVQWDGWHVAQMAWHVFDGASLLLVGVLALADWMRDTVFGFYFPITSFYLTASVYFLIFILVVKNLIYGGIFELLYPL